MGAIGPGGILEVSGRAEGAGAAVVPDAAHGATVGPAVGGGLDAAAQGALVPLPGAGIVAGAGSFGRDWGPEAVCTEAGGGMALGSRSQLKRNPNGKCCTTGNLPSTSPLYIFIMP